MLLALPDISEIRKADGVSCAAGAVAIALSALDMQWRLGSLVNYLNVTGVDGSDPRTVESYLRRIGLCLSAGEMDLGDLRYHARRGRPVICAIEGHWVVSAGIKRGKVHYMDPDEGPKRLAETDFLAIWHDQDRLGSYYRRWGIAVGREIQ